MPAGIEDFLSPDAKPIMSIELSLLLDLVACIALGPSVLLTGLSWLGIEREAARLCVLENSDPEIDVS